MTDFLTSGGAGAAPVFLTAPVVRSISSGSTGMTALATTDVATVTRTAGERILPSGFITDAVANVAWGDGFSISVDGIAFELRRTTNANEFKLTLICGATGRTLDWMILGIT